MVQNLSSRGSTLVFVLVRCASRATSDLAGNGAIVTRMSVGVDRLSYYLEHLAFVLPRSVTSPVTEETSGRREP